MYMRPFGKLGFDVSTFGFGAMRLPAAADGSVDENESIRMVHAAIDGGVNYFDTAFVYLNGNSEVTLGKALQGGLRDKVRVASKLATWVDSPATYEEQLDLSLKRLQTDHIDFYLFHALTAERWQTDGEKVTRFMDDMVKKGKILYPSFSFHDTPELFKTIIDAYDWKMAQVQFNFLDEDAKDQAALSGIRHAASKDVPIVVMEPLRGGQLATSVPARVQSLYDGAPVSRSPVEWAFRYIYDFPEVACILSGVSTMQQLTHNVAIFKDAAPSSMAQEEKAMIAQVRDVYHALMKAGCTGCAYCMPCPFGVQIPQVLRGYDNAYVFENMDGFKRAYASLEKEGGAQDQCTQCGQCEAQCPQHIPIIAKLADAAACAHG